MPRYLVEQIFLDTLQIPTTSDGASTFQSMVAANIEDGVTWLHSYVSIDKRKAFCVVDGPSPEAIRRVAKRNKLPIDKITEVSVLDPYFYR